MHELYSFLWTVSTVDICKLYITCHNKTKWLSFLNRKAEKEGKGKEKALQYSQWTALAIQLASIYRRVGNFKGNFFLSKPCSLLSFDRQIDPYCKLLVMKVHTFRYPLVLISQKRCVCPYLTQLVSKLCRQMSEMHTPFNVMFSRSIVTRGNCCVFIHWIGRSILLHDIFMLMYSYTFLFF